LIFGYIISDLSIFVYIIWQEKSKKYLSASAAGRLPRMRGIYELSNKRDKFLLFTTKIKA
jgi:hypothetical protein